MPADLNNIVGSNIGAIAMGLIMLRFFAEQRKQDSLERKERDEAFIAVIKENTSAMQKSSDTMGELKNMLQTIYKRNHELVREKEHLTKKSPASVRA